MHKPLLALYLLLVLVVVWILSFAIPPLQSMDEPKHFIKSYALSQGQVFCSTHEGKTGMWVPKEVAEIRTYFESSRDLIANPLGSYTKPTTSSSISENAVFAHHPFCEAPPTAYIPQAIGISIGTLFTMDIETLLLSARLFNALILVLLLSIAISLFPHGKILAATIGGIPMILYQSSTASPDGFLFIGTLLLVGLFLRLASKPTLDTKNCLILLLTSVLIIHCKVGYQLLALLIFLLPSTLWKSKKSYILFLVTYFIVHILCFITIRELFSISATDTLHGLDRLANIKFIFTSPFQFLELVSTTIQLQGFHFTRQSLGSIGWQHSSLSFIHLTLLIGGLFSVFLFSSQEKDTFSPKTRFVLIGTSLLLFLSVFGALFILLHKPSLEYIRGIQGKYFIPALIPFLFGIYGLRIPLKKMVIVLLGVLLLSNGMLIWHTLQLRTPPAPSTMASYPITYQKRFQYILSPEVTANSTITIGFDIQASLPKIQYFVQISNKDCSKRVVSHKLPPSFFQEHNSLTITLPEEYRKQPLCLEIHPTRSTGDTTPLYILGHWRNGLFHPQ